MDKYDIRQGSLVELGKSFSSPNAFSQEDARYELTYYHGPGPWKVSHVRVTPLGCKFISIGTGRSRVEYFYGRFKPYYYPAQLRNRELLKKKTEKDRTGEEK